MGLFDHPPFDLNGDGKTDFLEFSIAMNAMEELEKEEKKNSRNACLNLDDENDNDEFDYDEFNDDEDSDSID